jgi:hypothetical protein
MRWVVFVQAGDVFGSVEVSATDALHALDQVDAIAAADVGLINWIEADPEDINEGTEIDAVAALPAVQWGHTLHEFGALAADDLLRRDAALAGRVFSAAKRGSIA